MQNYLDDLDPVALGALLSIIGAIAAMVTFLFERLFRKIGSERLVARFSDQARKIRELESIVRKLESDVEKKTHGDKVPAEEILDIKSQITKLNKISSELKEDSDVYSSKDLSRYYQHMLKQSNASFYFSIIFAAIGFSVILYTVATYEEGRKELAVLQGIAGIVVEVFSALFIINVNSTRKSVIQFLEKLREDNRYDTSLRISDEIKDQKWRDRMKIILSTHMAGVMTNDDRAIISRAISSLFDGDDKSASAVKR